MIFPQYLRNLDSLRNEEDGASALHKKTKNDELIFFLAWNIMLTDNQKILILNFLEVKNIVFLSQKDDGNIICTDY